METTTMTYFVCLNSDCERHRNIFLEGDPLHERCERRALEFDDGGERGAPWAWIALAAGLGIAAAAAVTVIRMRRGGDDGQSLHETRPMQTWSGTEAHLDERRGHPVPPPMK